MSTRLYYVTGLDGSKHLVDANTPSQAMRHIAQAQYQVKVASGKEVAALMGQGVKIQTASASDEVQGSIEVIGDEPTV